MSEPSAITDDAPSPWWPCPECGFEHFRVICCWERGNWQPCGYDEDGEPAFKWQAFDPPRGAPSGVSTMAECMNCRTTTDLATHYNWPIVGAS